MPHLSNRSGAFAKNLAIVFIGSVGGRIIGFAMLPLYTRWMTPAEYGLADLAYIITIALMGLYTLQIQDSVFIFPRNHKKEDQKIYFLSGLIFLAWSTIIFAILFYVFSNLQILVKTEIKQLAPYIFGMLILGSVQNYVQQYCRSVDYIISYAVSGFVLAAATAVSGFLLIPTLHVKGYLIAQIVGSLAGLVAAMLLGKLWRHVDSSYSSVYLIEMLKYSTPLIPTTMMWWCIFSMNRPLLAAYYGLTAVGIFAVASKFPTLLGVFWSIFDNAWGISVLDEYHKDGFAQFYNKMHRLLLGLLVAITLFLTYFANEIVDFIVGNKFRGAELYIPIVVYGMVFSIMGGFVSRLYMAAKCSKYFLYTSIYTAIAALVLNALLVPLFGLYGASVSALGALIVHYVTRNWYAYRLVSVQNWNSVICMLLMPMVLYFQMLVFPDRVLSAITMVVSLMLLSLMLREEIEKLIQLSRRYLQ